MPKNQVPPFVDLSDALLEIDVALLQLGHASGDIHNLTIKPEFLKHCAKQVAFQQKKDPNDWATLVRILFNATELNQEDFEQGKQYSQYEDFPYELIHWKSLKSQLNEEFINKIHGQLCNKQASYLNSSMMKFINSSPKAIAPTGISTPPTPG